MSLSAAPTGTRTIADVIAPYLPLLRRFARALTGSQSVGDRYVVATLEALLADQNIFDATVAPRVSLYRAFYVIWSSAGGDSVAPSDRPEDPSNPLSAQIAALTPKSRQALLLTAMERFEPAEAALIMGVSPAEAAALADEAIAEVKGQPPANVLIIEDEAIIALDLEAIVEGLGHSVFATASTHAEATAACRDQKPDLVLADIQLADGSSGIEAVAEILADHTAPVIFITAYPERLLTGERPEPTYLISKPFEETEVAAAVSQALSQKQAQLQ